MLRSAYKRTSAPVRRSNVKAILSAPGFVKKSTAQKDHRLLKKVAKQVLSAPKAYLGQYYTRASFTGVLYTQNLTLINTADKIFGSDAGDMDKNKCKLLSSKIEGHIRLSTEDDGVDMTILIVRPKQTLQGWDPSTGVLPTLTANQDYYNTDTAVFMNSNVFSTLYRKVVRLYMTGTTSVTLPAQTVDGTDCYFRKIIKHNRFVSSKAGAVSSLVCPLDEQDNVFLLVFNNNTSVDGENPTMTWQQITEVQTY